MNELEALGAKTNRQDALYEKWKAKIKTSTEILRAVYPEPRCIVPTRAKSGKPRAL
jgi:hypothetical protein